MRSISLEDGPPDIDASSGRTKVSVRVAERKRRHADDLQAFIHRTWDEGSWTFVDGVGVDLLMAGIDS
jgi:hypothetical protein